MKKWLPPMEVCCTRAKLRITIQSNLTLHFKTICEEHGIKGITSPFSKSLMDYEIKISDKLASYSKETRREKSLFDNREE